MAHIYETPNYIVETRAHPFVSKEEGGHVCVSSKIQVTDRTKLNPVQAIEYMKLSMVTGEALTNTLKAQGIDVGIVNYQEMGNWMVFKPGGPIMHMHIFGRAKTAVIQKYGEAVLLPHIETGFYDKFEGLNEDDIKAMKTEIERLLSTEKYKTFVSNF